MKTPPATAYRAAIHNQIYASIYHHISQYERNPATGKLRYVDSWGHRPGGGWPNKALGMSRAEARAEADKRNLIAGWGSVPKTERPKWVLPAHP